MYAVLRTATQDEVEFVHVPSEMGPLELLHCKNPIKIFSVTDLRAYHGNKGSDNYFAWSVMDKLGFYQDQENRSYPGDVVLSSYRAFPLIPDEQEMIRVKQ